MNLLEQRKQNELFNSINPFSIRQYQYNFILEFIENAINFLSQQKDNYLQISNKTIHQRINYKGVYNSSFSKVSIDVRNISENRIYHFTNFFIPTLIENNHLFGEYQSKGTRLKIKLIHEPEKGIIDNDLFFLYGHIHRLQTVKRNGVNVGVDCHHFFPINLDDVYFQINGVLNHYDKNVFMDKIGVN